MAVQPDADPVNDTEASKERIMKCGPLWKWFEVLAISRLSSVDDTKKGYRKLCLLHHPDKAGGDADTFKVLHKAYTEGVRICMVRSSKMGNSQVKRLSVTKRNEAKAKVRMKPKAEKRVPKEKKPVVEKPPPPPEVKIDPLLLSAQARKELTEKLFEEAAIAPAPAAAARKVKRAKPKAVAANASKGKLHAAIARWDTGNFKAKTMPDEVESAAPATAAAWLKEGSCVPVDVRSDIKGSLPGSSCAFTYFQLLTAPEEVAAEVHRLREDGKRLLIFSQDGASMGPCALVGSLLLDVFGFDDDAVFRLQGGYEALKPLLDCGADNGVTLEAALNARKTLVAAKKAQKEADTALARSKADLAIYSAASREHLNVLDKATWATEDNAREHLVQLSPLLKPLKLESSLLAMLTNAALKRPAQRGPFDSMVFSELGKRFAERIASLQVEVTAAASLVSKQAGVVKAAQAEVDEARRTCGSPAASPTKKARTSWPSGSLVASDAEAAAAAEKVAALQAAASKAAAEKIAAQEASVARPVAEQAQAAEGVKDAD